jgi:hypothetical protein
MANLQVIVNSNVKGLLYEYIFKKHNKEISRF